MDRHLKQRVGFAMLALTAVAVVVPILLVVGALVAEGVEAISWEFVSAMPREGMKAGGIFPAIVGTLVLTLGVAVAAIPVGVGGAIYLSEYARDTFVTRAIRLAIINLAGIPSVVYGLFGMGLFVLFLQFGFTTYFSLVKHATIENMGITLTRISVWELRSHIMRWEKIKKLSHIL